MKTTNEQNLKNKNHGITLIALVITIIVMLILVAVTITMAVNGGLFSQASSAGKQTNEKVQEELEYANVSADMTVQDLINKYTNTQNQGNNSKGKCISCEGKKFIPEGERPWYDENGKPYCKTHGTHEEWITKIYDDELEENITMYLCSLCLEEGKYNTNNGWVCEDCKGTGKEVLCIECLDTGKIPIKNCIECASTNIIKNNKQEICGECGGSVEIDWIACECASCKTCLGKKITHRDWGCTKCKNTDIEYIEKLGGMACSKCNSKEFIHENMAILCPDCGVCWTCYDGKMPVEILCCTKCDGEDFKEVEFYVYACEQGCDYEITKTKNETTNCPECGYECCMWEEYEELCTKCESTSKYWKEIECPDC